MNHAITTSAEAPPHWQTRFDFFEAHGSQTSSRSARLAYRALPLRHRMRVGTNPMAFLFGPLYFFTLGMWRKGVTLLVLGLFLGTACTVYDVPESVATPLSMVVASIAMTTANYAYFLHVRIGSQSWNPFERAARR